MLRNLIYVALLFACLGCSSLPQVCRPEGANQAGRNQALHGDEYNPAMGSVCTDEHQAIFTTNFQAGYQQGKQQYCAPTSVESTGNTHGSQGQPSQYSAQNYRICENVSELKGAYTRGHKAGVLNYCSETRSQTLGREQGQKGYPSDFVSETYTVCNASQIAKAGKAYKLGYQDGLNTFCTGTGIEGQAFQTGSQGAAPADILASYTRCPASKQKQIAALYKAHYDRGLATYCAPDKLEHEANQQVRTANTSVFPSKFERCEAQIPTIREQFSSIFNRNRSAYVQAECTHARGMREGSADANRITDKNTSIPVFCDPNLFGVYFSGYVDGFRQTKDRLCDGTAAYSAGLRDASSGKAQVFTPPSLCPLEYQNSIRQRYTEGFNLGIMQKLNRKS